MQALISCSSYINRMHREFDREDQGKHVRKSDRFDMYRRPENRYGNSQAVSTAEQKNVMPTIQRYYENKNLPKKRYTADDLADNQSDGSLWANQGSNGYLFTKETMKKTGDIVLIEVKAKMRTEINQELTKAFPDLPKYNSTSKTADGKTADAAKASEAAPTPAPEVAAPTKEDGKDTVYDRISSIIVEEINKDHILVRGRKDVIHKGVKRTVEVQALSSRRSVAGDDMINSDDLLETNVTVVR